jgi:hypothetical protein
MLEKDGKRILLTTDAHDDIVLGALEQAGYTDAYGNMEVDVLVLPRAGSNRYISDELFRRVKARHYVISSDAAKYRLPSVTTFEMLFAARRGDPRAFSIDLTYAPEEYRQGYPLRRLCTLLARERSAGTPFEIVTPARGQSSFGIDLGANATFVDKGVRNTVCGL